MVKYITWDPEEGQSAISPVGGMLSRKQWSGILEHEKEVNKQRRRELHRLRLIKAQELQS